MTREECENKILEKLEEIKDIAKQYDKADNFYLGLTILDNYMSVSNSCENIKTPINVTLIGGETIHWGA